MEPLEYIITALDSWRFYLAALAVAAPIYFAMARRFAIGVFDPFFVVLLTDAFGWALVATMYWRGDISSFHFLIFLSTQIFFCVGLYLGQLLTPAVQPRLRAPVESLGPSRIVFSVAAAAQVGTTLLIWGLAGIPLFRASRLGAFYGSGGLGIIERISTVSGEVAIFSALFIWFSTPDRRGRMGVKLFIGWFVVCIALSGSKGGLLGFGYYIFCLYFISRNSTDVKSSYFWGGRWGVRFIALALLFALLVLAIQGRADMATTAAALAFRIISYADVYIYAYPGNTIDGVHGGNWFFGLFGALLGTLRLIPADLIDQNIGLSLTGIVSPGLTYLSGPNPRQAVYGYHYFGIFAFAFSLVLGTVTTIAQRRLYIYGRNRGYFSLLFRFELYFCLVGMSSDFSNAMSKLASLIITLPLILIPSLSVYHATRTQRSFLG